MQTTGLSVAALATLTLGIVAFSGGPTRTATASQRGCTQASPVITEWFQALLDEEDDLTREILALSHLKNQPVVTLGGQAGDDEICDHLFQQLHEHYRTLLIAVPPEAVVYYYRVGDRYLVYVGTSDVTASLWDIVFSFDLEFNELARGS